MKDHNERLERIRKGEIEEDLDIDTVVARIWNVCGWDRSPDQAAEELYSCIIERKRGFVSGKELWLPWIKMLAEDEQLFDRLTESASYSKEQWLDILKKLIHTLWEG
jgi:hypothetical protein